MELAKLHEELETTIIYVTHDQTEAMTLGTRIVVMKDGVVQQVEAPIQLYNNPANLFVAGFIGSPSMNFFDVLCRRRRGKSCSLPWRQRAGKESLLKRRESGSGKTERNE